MIQIVKIVGYVIAVIGTAIIARNFIEFAQALKIGKETKKKNYNRDWDWCIVESIIGIIILIICYLLQNVI